jgi:hypothetical protein
MKLDLQKDAQKIGRYIQQRVRDYPVFINLGPGKDDDPISLVTLGYYVEQTGYLALVFDTRPDADNDGQWTLHIENDVNVIAFPKWLAAFERLCGRSQVAERQKADARRLGRQRQRRPAFRRDYPRLFARSPRRGRARSIAPRSKGVLRGRGVRRPVGLARLRQTQTARAIAEEVVLR